MGRAETAWAGIGPGVCGAVAAICAMLVLLFIFSLQAAGSRL
jgi:hypothetical protein